MRRSVGKFIYILIAFLIVAFIIIFLVLQNQHSYKYTCQQYITKPINVSVQVLDRNTASSSISFNMQLSKHSAMNEVLPAADSFSRYTGNLITLYPDTVYVSECYLSTNDVGIVVIVNSSSYGGMLTSVIGINDNGQITGIKVSTHSDTSGLGTKVYDSQYLDQYIGISQLTNAANIIDDPNVEAVTGATISSNAIYQAACVALQQYNSI